MAFPWYTMREREREKGHLVSLCISTLILLDQGLVIINSFFPYSKYRHCGIRASTYDFGERHKIHFLIAIIVSTLSFISTNKMSKVTVAQKGGGVRG